MKSRNSIVILISVILALILSGCPPNITLPGDIRGSVKEEATSEPIQGATVKLNQTSDSTFSKDDGAYLIKNIDHGNYKIQASKHGYVRITEDVEVFSGTTQTIDFNLDKIPWPDLSESVLAFDLDSTSVPFIISNTSTGTLTYNLIPSQSWITVTPSVGIISNTDTIIVTIDRTEISDSINYDETIKLKSSIGPDELPDILIDVCVNGIYDPRSKTHYPVVKIGSRRWMAKNLNVGDFIYSWKITSDNNIIEKWCYNNVESNCDIYGGLYQWPEMMQYNPSDSGIIGTTQGICPDGYHIPTVSEWDILASSLGGMEVAGGKLKETGTIHWLPPNKAANNESGFTALPAGYAGCDEYFYLLGEEAQFYSSTANPPPMEIWINTFQLFYNGDNAWIYNPVGCIGVSVRCVKDP
jgi:uncharacterized protein (TIGR02145 family)